MFFKQIRRNAAKNRKSNGLFFGSLIIAVIAFYTLLSLEQQDVVKFLKTIESDAVQKLMLLIPAVYCASLFFVFFLVYFACKYQFGARRKEFGLYLMMGMRRSRLFFMMLCETLWSSLISLFAGIPAALLLTEGISLATTRLLGLGIIGHSFSFSLKALMWTAVGFIAVQLLSLLVIIFPLGKAQPGELMSKNSAARQKVSMNLQNSVCFTFGLLFLGAAYFCGMFLLRETAFDYYFIIIFITGAAGVIGTFLFFKGLGGFIGRVQTGKSKKGAGLSCFTARQLQESVLSQHSSLAISSLLMLVAFACISFGISLGVGMSSETRAVDLSVMGEINEVNEIIGNSALRDITENAYPVYLKGVYEHIDNSELKEALSGRSDGKSYAESFHTEYILALSSYNNLLAAANKEPLTLLDAQAALYSNMPDPGKLFEALGKVLEDGVGISVDGERFTLLPQLYTENIVADRSITLYTALIVSDNVYKSLVETDKPFCININLKQSVIDDMGLMAAIQMANEELDKTGLEYDSYLKGIGRNLFYSVAAGYLTVYLGVLFLIISNTVIGIKFLIQQRENRHRYVTLQMLGAKTDDLRRSAAKQINFYFLMVVGIAVFSGIFAVASLFLNFTQLPAGTDVVRIVLLAVIAAAALALTEVIYVSIVKRNAYREINGLKITERG